MTLKEIHKKYERTVNGLTWPDKDNVHSYIDIYAEQLAPYRTTAKNILEIGLMSGDSLRMWEEYFSGTVHGMDCDIQPHGGLADLRPIMQEYNHHIYILDATDKKQVGRAFKGIKFDVIIEDAGHEITQQLTIYNNFKKHLSKGGIYIIEDIQDIDLHRKLFEQIDNEKTVFIFDRRRIKNRYDDVMVVIK